MGFLRRVAPFFAAFAASLAQDRVTLPNHVHPSTREAIDRGPVPADFPVPDMIMFLRPSPAQREALVRFLEAQRDPRSPDYRRWLAPEQFADLFAPSRAQVRSLETWLVGRGFRTGPPSRGCLWISFAGTAAQVRAAFQTEIHRYLVDGVSHYAPASNPSVPAGFGELVWAIAGLHDFLPTPSAHAHPADNLANGAHGLGPGDIATIYNITPLHTSGLDGSGQSIAIVGTTQVDPADIRTFRDHFGLPALNLRTILPPGFADPGINSDSLAEADIDLEWAGAAARNAPLIYIYGRSAFSAAAYAIDQNLAPILSESFGGCEASNASVLGSYQLIAQQANAQGITWINSSGDTGAGGCERNGAPLAQNGSRPQFPTAIPEVTGVGGTEFDEGSGNYWAASNTPLFSSALGYIPEVAWNDTVALSALWATTGGASTYYPKPVWQTGPGVPADAMRDTPDLAMAASFHHDGYFVATAGKPALCCYGGTSVAAPLFAGIVALLNQSQGSRSGNINPALYRLAQSSPGVFHDIASGTNIVPCAAASPDCSSGQFGFSAGPGYDLATGLGSVDAANFVHQFPTQPAKSSAVVAAISPNPVYQHAPDSDGFSWSYTISLSEEAGVGATLTGFTIDGQDFTSQIVAFFGGASIPPAGNIRASLGAKGLAVPLTRTFVFNGSDAAGNTWSRQVTVSFLPTETPIVISGDSNAASFSQSYAPGMILSVFGSTLGNGPQASAAVPLPTFLAGTRASINGVAAPLYFVSPGQLNIQIPYETQPGPATLTVVYGNQSATANFTVSAAAPGIFTGAAAALVPNASGSRGQTLLLFLTGEGSVTPAIATGSSPAPSTPVTGLPKPKQTVTVTVGGMPASVAFAGIPSGLVGVTQINFVVPPAAPTGLQPVVVTVGGVASQPAMLNVTP